MARHLTHNQKVDIVKAFTEDLESVSSIARRYERSRQAIYKFLKKIGIDPNEYSKMDVSCTVCGKIITRNKARIRKQKNHFCTYECYYAFLVCGNGQTYIPNRQGQRTARRVVSEYFTLEEGHIVHHEDRNNLNNLPYNLKVFACQGDHVRYHRGFEVEPIWDGTVVARLYRTTHIP